MKKHILFILSIILLMLIAYSCNVKRQAKTVEEYIKNLDTYKSEVYIEIHSNKGTSNYHQIQFFKNPNKIRIETIKPEFLKGKIMVLNNKKMEIYHPLINQKFEGTFEGEEAFIHLGIIQSSFLSSKGFKTSIDFIDGEEYIKVTTKIEGDNIYKDKGVIYFKSRDIRPVYFEIYDASGTLRYKLKFINFEYNTKIDDDVFVLK